MQPCIEVTGHVLELPCKVLDLCCSFGYLCLFDGKI